MRLAVTLQSYQLRVLASIFADLTAGWFLGLFAVKSIWALTGNLIGVIFSLYIALKLEKSLEGL